MNCKALRYNCQPENGHIEPREKICTRALIEMRCCTFYLRARLNKRSMRRLILRIAMQIDFAIRRPFAINVSSELHRILLNAVIVDRVYRKIQASNVFFGKQWNETFRETLERAITQIPKAQINFLRASLRRLIVREKRGGRGARWSSLIASYISLEARTVAALVRVKKRAKKGW